MTEMPPLAPLGVESLAAARRSQRRRAYRNVVLFVLAPTLLVGIYRGLLQTRFYESVAVVAVEANGPTPLDTRHDALALRSFATSRDMLRELVDHHRYADHFASGSVDRLSRLARGASFEAKYDHFLAHVNVDIDSESGFLVIRTRAHDGTTAREFDRAIVDAMRERVRSFGRAEGDTTSPPSRRLVVVSSPSRPDRAAGPKPIRAIATTLFACIALLVIGSIVVTTAKEHADV